MNLKGKNKIKLLFIGHDASLTGAPLVLYYLIEKIIATKKYDCALFLLKGGHIAGRYKKLGIPVFIQDQLLLSPIEFVYSLRPDLVYGNTILSSPLLAEIGKSKRIPVILHVHELSHSIQTLIGRTELKDYSLNINTIIAAGAGVLSCLKNEVKIKGPKLISVEEFGPFKTLAARCKKIKKNYSILPDITNKQQIVLGCGTGYWRKGVDVFVQVAKKVTDRLGNVIFVWVGALAPLEMEQLEYDKKNLGLSKKLIFTGPKDTTLPYFKISSLFLLTSREDPFPLVCLEAASMNVPVICFNKGTGIIEFVKEKAAVSAKYLDVTDTAEKVIKLLNDKNAAIKLTERAYKKTINNNTAEKLVPKIEKEISELVSGSNPVLDLAYKNLNSSIDGNRALVSKLYFDKAMDFCEEKVFKSFLFFTSKVKFEVYFYLNKRLDVFNLRWDPIDFGTCHLKLTEVSGIEQSGKKVNFIIKSIPHNGNISPLKKSYIYFNHDDPFLLIMNRGNFTELRIKGEMIIVI